MKKVFFLLFALALACFAGCNNPAVDETTPLIFEQQKGGLDFRVQYIRTDGGYGELYPEVRIIDSRSGLESYYNANKDRYNLARRDTVYADESIGFLDACDKYDDTFFAEHKLIFVILEEPSGSIRHRVNEVLNWYDAGKCEIYIDRIIPEVGTSDMAQWHLIFEVPKDSNPSTEEDVMVYLDEELVFNGQKIVPPSPPVFLKPPECTLRTPTDDVTISSYSYNWTVEQPDGTAISTVTDTLSRPLPEDALTPIRLDPKFAETVYMPVPETSIYEPTNSLGYLVKFAWEAPPSSVTCVCWSDSVWTDNTIPEENHHFDPEGLFYAKEGGYIYEFSATWENNGSGFYGTAQYYVYIIGGSH